MEKELEHRIEKIAPTIEKYRTDKTMTPHMIALEIIKQIDGEKNIPSNSVLADSLPISELKDALGEGKITKHCVSCGKAGHTYLECEKLPFMGMVASAFGLPSKPYCGLDEQQIIENIKEVNIKR